MKIKDYDRLEFSSDAYGGISVCFVSKNIKTQLDFNRYIRHNDTGETEMRCEIDALLPECDMEELLAKLNQHNS